MTEEHQVVTSESAEWCVQCSDTDRPGEERRSCLGKLPDPPQFERYSFSRLPGGARKVQHRQSDLRQNCEGKIKQNNKSHVSWETSSSNN